MHPSLRAITPRRGRNLRTLHPEDSRNPSEKQQRDLEEQEKSAPRPQQRGRARSDGWAPVLTWDGLAGWCEPRMLLSNRRPKARTQVPERDEDRRLIGHRSWFRDGRDPYSSTDPSYERSATAAAMKDDRFPESCMPLGASRCIRCQKADQQNRAAPSILINMEHHAGEKVASIRRSRATSQSATIRAKA